MICKRMMRAAVFGLAGFGAVAGLLLTAPHAMAATTDVDAEVETASQENRLSLFHDYSLDAVGLTTGQIPGSAGGGLLTSMLGQYASTDTSGTGRSFQISFTPLAGYDSNPEAREFSRASAFGGGDLSASYQCNLGPWDPTVGSPNEFRLSYDFTGAVYDGTVPDADVTQQTLAWSYRRSLFDDRVFLKLSIQDQFTMEHGSATLNTLDCIPSMEWFFYPQASIEVNYDYTDLLFYQPVVGRRDENADRSTINLKVHLYPTPQVRGEIPESPDVLGDILRQTLYRATLGYTASFNEPSPGTEYQYEGNAVSLGFEGVHLPQFKNSRVDFSNLTMDLMYAHEWDSYLNPSTEGPVVLAGSPKQVRRADHIDVFTFRTNARLLDFTQNRGTLGAYVQWDIIADRSNIPARHFNEDIVSGGFTYQY